jgi:NCAIR mutase (PurE)-related protein
MERQHLRTLLEDVRAGDVEVDAALEHLATMPFEDLGDAMVDHHRALRQGFPEVIFGHGKTPAQVASIFAALAARSPRVLATRVGREAAESVLDAVPDALFHEPARLLVLEREPLERVPAVAVVTAGTSDVPIAEEAALTAEVMGNAVHRFYDVGVAGLHRLLAVLPRIRACNAVVVIAGMEGALPSVVGGLVSVPVIAVPTSVGYGASLGGVAALLGMLNSCATGVSVVNIDNGFGAAAVASMINRGRGL